MRLASIGDSPAVAARSPPIFPGATQLTVTYAGVESIVDVSVVAPESETAVVGVDGGAVEATDGTILGIAPGALAEDDINVVGPIARSAGDLALGLEILAGPTAERGKAWRLDLPLEIHEVGFGGLAEPVALTLAPKVR